LIAEGESIVVVVAFILCVPVFSVLF
jgi:hypothetical protein